MTHEHIDLKLLNYYLKIKTHAYYRTCSVYRRIVMMVQYLDDLKKKIRAGSAKLARTSPAVRLRKPIARTIGQELKNK